MEFALKRYRELERQDNGAPLWSLRVAECYRRLGRNDGERSALMRAADRYERRGFAREALALWSRIHTRAPDDPDVERALERLTRACGQGLARLRSSIPPASEVMRAPSLPARQSGIVSTPDTPSPELPRAPRVPSFPIEDPRRERASGYSHADPARDEHHRLELDALDGAEEIAVVIEVEEDRVTGRRGTGPVTAPSSAGLHNVTAAVPVANDRVAPARSGHVSGTFAATPASDRRPALRTPLPAPPSAPGPSIIPAPVFGVGDVSETPRPPPTPSNPPRSRPEDSLSLRDRVPSRFPTPVGFPAPPTAGIATAVPDVPGSRLPQVTAPQAQAVWTSLPLEASSTPRAPIVAVGAAPDDDVGVSIEYTDVELLPFLEDIDSEW